MSVIRFLGPFNIKSIQSLRCSIELKKFYSRNSDSSDSDDEKSDKKSSPAPSKSASADRLKELLTKMTTESNLNLVQSVVKAPKKRKTPTHDRTDDDAKPTNIFAATKKVAEELGGDTKLTESELLSKLLNLSGESDPNKKDATDNVGKSFDLSEIIANMKVDSTKKLESFDGRSKGRSDQRTYPNRDEVRSKNKMWQKEMRSNQGLSGHVDFFGGKPLDIFNVVDNLKAPSNSLKLWDEMKRQELQIAFQQSPRNYFDKMSRWTKEGKLWKFPIDNEQGLDDEAQIPFTEHIFLDRHLDGWCPPKGPLRHFMELVCVGLSKNPYYTVAQKVEHIQWYQNYFAEKKDILSKAIIHESNAESKKELSPSK